MLFVKKNEFFRIFSDISSCFQKKTINEQIIQQSIKAITFIMLNSLILIKDHVSLQPYLFCIFQV